MHKLWRYNGYDLSLGCIPTGTTIKQIFYFQEPTPGADYTEITDSNYLIKYHTRRDSQRRLAAIEYADTMNATRIIFADIGNTDQQNLDIRLETEAAFRETEMALMRGRWDIALNEVGKVIATADVPQSLIDEIETYISDYMDNNY